MHSELNPDEAYRFVDFDGESLTVRRVADGHGGHMEVEYLGAGPVHFNNSDDVLRFALALIARGVDEDLPHVRTAKGWLKAAIEETEASQRFQRGQEVEMKQWREDGENSEEVWRTGTVVGYADGFGVYTILPDGSGVYSEYLEHEMREVNN